MNLKTRVIGQISRRLPPSAVAAVDGLRPSLRDSWGGPLNGQPFRRAMVREIARSIDFDLVLETGTYRGSSAEFFSAVFGTPVRTVEANRRYFEYSKRRLAVLGDVDISLGDSRAWLRRMVREQPQATTFVYLDAHWHDDLPLRDECRIIARSLERAVIMIDDFEVPGDHGYHYDDYGPSKALTAEYLPLDDMKGWSVRYPAAPSVKEEGMRRGCCVLGAPAVANVIDSLATLRP